MGRGRQGLGGIEGSDRGGRYTRRAGLRALAALGALGAWPLAACGGFGSTGTAQGEAAARSQGPATVRFAAAGLGTELQIWTEVVETYNAQGAGITVQYEPCTAGSASAQDCLPVYFTQFVAGSPPDVWRVDDEPLPFYADKGMYFELDRLFARDARQLNPADFFPRALAAYRYDRQAFRFGQGKLYALPFNTGGDVLYYNKRLFAEAGVPVPPPDGSWTIDDWLERARRLAVLEPDGAMRTAALAGRPSFRGNLSWLWAHGAQFLDGSGRRWTFTAPETVRAYEWLVDLRRRHKVVPGPTDLQGQGNLFFAGRAAMALNFPNNLRELYARPELEWDVAPFPKAVDGQRYTRETADGVGLPAGAKQVEPAWTFVKWLTSAEGAKIFTRAGRAVPARRSAATSPDYVRPDTPQHEEEIVKALEYSRLQPVTLMFNDAEQMVRAYENAMFDEKEPLPVGPALRQLQEALDKLERDRAKPEGWEPRR
ncbi:MAG TPA: extracellular solute-binding protein [Chloroflexota bacterium]|nr:extracellular solute-binding protein [Chloroflexota bacterium]